VTWLLGGMFLLRPPVGVGRFRWFDFVTLYVILCDDHALWSPLLCPGATSRVLLYRPTLPSYVFLTTLPRRSALEACRFASITCTFHYAPLPIFSLEASVLVLCFAIPEWLTRYDLIDLTRCSRRLMMPRPPFLWCVFRSPPLSRDLLARGNPVLRPPFYLSITIQRVRVPSCTSWDLAGRVVLGLASCRPPPFSTTVSFWME